MNDSNLDSFQTTHFLVIVWNLVRIKLQKLKEVKWKTEFDDLPIGWKIVNKTIWILGTGGFIFDSFRQVASLTDLKIAYNLYTYKLFLNILLFVL